MSEANRLLKNTIVYAVGNIGSKILSFILVPLFSFYLTRSELGSYDLLLTTVSLFIPFVTLQISDAAYRWVIQSAKDGEEELKAISNGFFIMSVTTVCFYILFFLVSVFFQFQYKYYFSVILLLSCYFPFFQQVVRSLGMNRLYSLAGILSTVLMCLSSVLLLVVFKQGIYGLFQASIFSIGVTCLFLVFKARLYRYIHVKKINRLTIKQMIAYSWPLIPNTISWWLITAVDRYIILYFLHADANGIYAVSSKFPTIILVINSVFMLAWQDHAIMANDKSSQNVFASNLFNKYVKFELALAIVLIAVSKPLVYFLVDNRYIDAWKYMPFLYLSVAFASFSAYIGVGYQKNKNTKGIFITTLWGAVANVLISLLLIKYIGLYATGIASFLSFLIVYYLRIRDTKSFFNLNVDHKVLLLITSVAVLTLSVVLFTTSVIVQYIVILSSLVMFVLLNKEIFNKIKLELLKIYNSKRPK